METISKLIRKKKVSRKVAEKLVKVQTRITANNRDSLERVQSYVSEHYGSHFRYVTLYFDSDHALVITGLTLNEYDELQLVCSDIQRMTGPIISIDETMYLSSDGLYNEKEE